MCGNNTIVATEQTAPKISHRTHHCTIATRALGYLNARCLCDSTAGYDEHFRCISKLLFSRTSFRAGTGRGRNLIQHSFRITIFPNFRWCMVVRTVTYDFEQFHTQSPFTIFHVVRWMSDKRSSYSPYRFHQRRHWSIQTCWQFRGVICAYIGWTWQRCVRVVKQLCPAHFRHVLIVRSDAHGGADILGGNMDLFNMSMWRCEMCGIDSPVGVARISFTCSVLSIRMYVAHRRGWIQDWCVCSTKEVEHETTHISRHLSCTIHSKNVLRGREVALYGGCFPILLPHVVVGS